jgi:hypothetical protein
LHRGLHVNTWQASLKIVQSLRDRPPQSGAFIFLSFGVVLAFLIANLENLRWCD